MSEKLSITNRLDFEVTAERIATALLQIAEVELARDVAIQQAQTDADARITELEAEIGVKLAACKKFATAHRTELLGQAKSAATSTAVFGFRTGTPKLKLQKGWKWPDVLAALKRLRAPAFIRVKESVDKQKLVSAKPAFLGKVGVERTATERFFVEPKVETPAAVKI